MKLTDLTARYELLKATPMLQSREPAIDFAGGVVEMMGQISDAVRDNTKQAFKLQELVGITRERLTGTIARLDDQCELVDLLTARIEVLETEIRKLKPYVDEGEE